jgi:sulfhydrogenase subunit beta (sulfur reductase)
MPTYRFEKPRLAPFITSLAKRYYQVFAPVRSDVLRFQEVTNGRDIDLTGNTYLPPKELFFVRRDPLFTFDGRTMALPVDPVGQRVLFGVRRCDLNAIAHQDIVYMRQRREPSYAVRREATILIGYHCSSPPSPYCFCGSMNLKDCQDLMFVERPGYFLVETGSAKGEEFVHSLPRYFAKTDEELKADDRRTPGTDHLATTDIAAFYNNELWEDGVKKCLSCAACTTLCPTCYCYEIHDEIALGDPGRGVRCRFWSSCQLKEFTRVAGDYSFRDKRADRFRHRIYHQIEYFRDRYGVSLCTGCGRCIAYCPTRIDWVDIVNRMVSNASAS